MTTPSSTSTTPSSSKSATAPASAPQKGSASTPVTTRQSSTVFGLCGSGITQGDRQITGTKLPTCEQVLRCLMFHIQDGSSVNRTKWKAEVDKNSNDGNDQPTRSHHWRVCVGTPTFVQHTILKNQKLVAMATRMKITPAQQSAYTKALIEETGGDVTKFTTSYAMVDRSRRQVGQEIAESCREEWDVPKFATLHWDSKLLSTLINQNVSEERLTFVVGNADELKLLGVPCYQPGTDQSTGDIIANLTTDLLEEWHCSDSIVNTTFDTTVSNTGHVSAACVKIQQKLNRALLWTGCRYHIGEIILSHVFDDLKIEVSKSPDVTLFTRFQSKYELLPYNSYNELSMFDPTPFDQAALDLMSKCRTTVLQLVESELNLRRDDYKEFVELCILFLNDKVSTQSQMYVFKHPSALHKARWMAKLLYAIKICLFEVHIKQLPKGTITEQNQVKKLRDFVTFITHIYSTWWMTCTSAVDAPWNDLQMFHLLLQYQTVNRLISNSAVKAFQRHLWFLTAEMVPLALFSEQTPVKAKRELADSLLASKPENPCRAPQDRFGTGFGKPKFPQITLTTQLTDLSSPDSWFFFHTLQLDSAFLTADVHVHDWHHTPSYITSAKNVRALNVVNDCAERGVKLSSDFLESARSEEHFQNVLQVVEHDRKRLPNLRKCVDTQ